MYIQIVNEPLPSVILRYLAYTQNYCIVRIIHSAGTVANYRLLALTSWRCYNMILYNNECLVISPAGTYRRRLPADCIHAGRVVV